MATAKPAKTGDTSIYFNKKKKNTKWPNKCVNEFVKKKQKKNKINKNQGHSKHSLSPALRNKYCKGHVKWDERRRKNIISIQSAKVLRANESYR